MRSIARTTAWAVAAACCLAAGHSALAEEPCWPLDLGHRYLTSNFMEYRDGRFHAGLDLKTNSRTGHVVRAVTSGDVVRLKAAVNGYGKAVYLRGPDGRMFVYAHLERLADALRDRLRAEQRRRGRYGVDIFLGPGELTVTRGQVLALSGQTGTLGPHLHFEVRDPAGRPLDPQAHGFAVVDTVAPRIMTVRAVPAAADAAVMGQSVAHLVGGSGRALQGRLPALTVRGAVAFSVAVHDVSDAMGHRLAPQSLRLSVDGDEVFVARNDTLDWDRNGHLRLEFLEVEGVRERWLHRHPTDAVRGRLGGPWFRQLAPGRHELALEATDRAGNTGRVLWRVDVLAEDERLPNPVDVSAPDGLAWQPARTGNRLPGAAPDGSDVWISPFRGPEPGSGIHELQLRPEETAGVLAPVSLWWLPVESPPVPAPASGLVATGVAAAYVAGAWPVTKPVEVPLPGAPPDDERTAVYRHHRRGWSYVGSVDVSDPGETFFRLTKPGLYAVLTDIEAPVIVTESQPCRVGPGPPVTDPAVTPPRWELLTVSVGDHGSGLAWNEIQAWLNGQPLIVEPDAPRNRILVELPPTIAAGRHKLGLEIADRAGNATATVLDVVVSGDSTTDVKKDQ